MKHKHMLMIENENDTPGHTLFSPVKTGYWDGTGGGNQMSLVMDIEPRKTYLYIFISGYYNHQEAKTLFREILQASTQYGLSKVLVDLRAVEGRMSTIQQYDYFTFAADQQIQTKTNKKMPYPRFAYVAAESLIDPGGFGETVAVNRGIRMRVTTDFNEALEWLHYDRPTYGSSPWASGAYMLRKFVYKGFNTFLPKGENPS